MRSVLSLLIVFCLVYPLHAGRTIRISSPQYSFLIDEPEGWMIDVRSAAQIAHFVVHKKGTTWRYADVAVFGRFVPREQDESLENFLKDDELRFQQSCPLSDIKPLEMEFSESSTHEFLVKTYSCIGKSEIVAVAQVPSFFVMISMSTQEGAEAFQQGMAAFKELIETFRFLPRREPLLPPKKP